MFSKNEFRDTLYYCDSSEKTICDPVKEGNFIEGIYESCLILLAIGLGLRFLGLLTMHVLSAPKRPELKPL